MKKYKIKEVYLRNITSHSETRLKGIPEAGSIALIGPNGAGKSSIVEAIYMALTLKPLRSNERDLVRRGASQGEIRLKLESDEDTIQSIIRIYSSGKRNKDTLLLRNEQSIASKSTAYKEAMANILGIRNVKEYHNLIRLTTLIPQGGLRELAEKMAKPREFRELVEAAIGLPDYRQAVDNLERYEIYAGDRYSFVTPRISSKDPRIIARNRRYRTLIDMITSVEKELEEAKHTYNKYLMLKEKYNGDLKVIEKKINELRETIEKLNQEKQAVISIIPSLEEKKKLLEEKKKELEATLTELDEAKKAAELLPKTEAIAKLSEYVAKIYKMEYKIRELEQEKKEIESTLEDIRIVEENDEAYRQYDNLGNELRLLQKELIKVSELKAGIEAQLRSMKEQKTILEELTMNLARELKAELTGDTEKDLKILENRVKELEKEKKRIESRLRDLDSEGSMLASIIEEKNKALEALMSATQPKCPVCGRDLDEEHRLRVSRRLEKEIQEYSEKLARIESDKVKTIEELTTIDTLFTTASRILDRINDIHSSIRDEDIREKQLKHDILSRKKEELTSRIHEIEETLKSLEEKVNSYKRSLANLKEKKIDVRDKAKLESAYNNVVDTFNNLKQIHQSTIRKILDATQKKNLEEAIIEIEEARRRLIELKVKASRLKELQDKARRLEEELLELDKVREELSKYKEKASSLEQLSMEKTRELEELVEEKDKLSTEIARLEANIENTNEKMKSLMTDLKDLKKAKSKMITSIMAGLILLETQEKLLENTRSSLENEMSKILGTFGLEYHAVSIRDTGSGFEVRALSRNEPNNSEGVPITVLSGGEKTALALAYVLALQRILAIRLGFLILDEPTSELDSERRETLMELINTLSTEQIADQLIIITHHEDVIDKVDKTCRVERASMGTGIGTSRVNCSLDGIF